MYTGIFGTIKPPHLLLRFVPNKLVNQEISYRANAHGVAIVLIRKKKYHEPCIPITIGSYQIESGK